MGFLGTPLGFIMRLIYNFISNYGWSLVVFTILIKLALFPLSVKQQKSTAKMGLMTPKQQALQKKYGKDKQKYQEELMKLYEEEGYNPMSSCLPMVLQMVVLFGIIDVVYKPLKHLLAIPADILKQATDLVGTAGGSSAELYIISQIQNGSTEFNNIFSGDVIQSIMNFDLNFLGLNLGVIPDFTFPIMLIPILSGVTSILVSIYSMRQQAQNGMQPQQGAGMMKGMMYIMPLFSVWFAFQLPAGVGLYWIISNITAFAQTFILHKIYSPEKMKIIAEKEAAQNKKKKPSKYQEAMRAAREEQRRKAGGAVSSDDSDNSDLNEEPIELDTMSASQRIALARKRMAQKYGDEYEG